MFTLPLLLLVSLVVAFPILDNKEPRDRFTLDISSRYAGGRDFISELAAARRRWGAEPSRRQLQLGAVSGRVELEPLGNDELYLTDVKIGNPPQTVKLAVDTGSSDLWVQSSDTIYRANLEGPWPPRYLPNTSRTSHFVQGADWNVGYIDGSRAGGLVYHDTLRLGPFTIETAPIQSAKIISSHFERAQGMSGVLGLGKRLGSNVHPAAPTILGLLRRQLKQPVFTIDVHSNATGRLGFGAIDASLARDDITWLDSRPESRHWDVELNLTSWSADPAVWYAYSFHATIDTGTSLMFLPDAIASLYWRSVDGMERDPVVQAYTFPCDRALPDLAFKLPGSEHVITVPGRYLNYGPIDDGNYCWGGMQSTEGIGSGAVLGDTMLKAVFVAFDLEKERVGFANKDLRVSTD